MARQLGPWWETAEHSAIDAFNILQELQRLWAGFLGRFVDVAAIPVQQPIPNWVSNEETEKKGSVDP